MECRIPPRMSLLFVLLWFGTVHLCDAGMPSPLPTSWTAESSEQGTGFNGSGPAAEARWQGLSFFVACLLLSAWGVKGLWNSLRRDLIWLPTIGYRGALGLVILWGFLFVIVLTMISGARELMTPGAWKKQGWTYKLAESSPADDTAARDQAFAVAIRALELRGDPRRAVSTGSRSLARPAPVGNPGMGKNALSLCFRPVG
jgi:hypothetical protein